MEKNSEYRLDEKNENIEELKDGVLDKIKSKKFIIITSILSILSIGGVTGTVIAKKDDIKKISSKSNKNTTQIINSKPKHNPPIDPAKRETWYFLYNSGKKD